MRKKMKVVPPTKAQPCLRGRSKELIQRRNVKLLIRFHHMTEVQRRRFDDVVTILSTEEFFISEKTVWQIVKRNLDILDKISKGELEGLDATANDPSQLQLFE